MSYGIEVQGHTTLLGWDDSGEIEPWTELQAWATMIRLRCEFRKLGQGQSSEIQNRVPR